MCCMLVKSAYVLHLWAAALDRTHPLTVHTLLLAMSICSNLDAHGWVADSWSSVAHHSDTRPSSKQCSAVQGNVILTDSKYEVLTLLRSHRDDAKGFAIMARHPYPIRTIRLRQAITAEQLDTALASDDDKQTLKGKL